MKKNIGLISLSVIMLLLTNCNLASPAPMLPSVAIPPPLAPAPILTPLPIATATSAPLPAPTLILPLAYGTPLPQLSHNISSDNANNIVEIAEWGGQTTPIWTVAFIPDGRILAAAGSENIVQLWDVSGAGESNTLSGHTGKVTSVAFSPDGKTLASGSADNTIKLWDVASGHELRTLNAHHLDDINSYGILDIVISPDGKMLASLSETVSTSTYNFLFNLDLWDVASGKQVRTWSKYWIWGIAFSPDSKMLAWGTSNVYWTDNNVIISDAASGHEISTFSGHEKRVNTVAFSPDGKTLASGSDDYRIRLWDLVSDSVLSTINNTENIISVRPNEITTPVISVAFSPDGKTLVSGSNPIPGLEYNTITLWDVVSGQKLSSLSGYMGAVYSVAFSPDGGFIASNSGDGTFRFWGVYP